MLEAKMFILLILFSFMYFIPILSENN